MLLQSGQKLWIRRRVGVPNVILRLDQSPLEKMLPVAIDKGSGKEWILGRAHPVGQFQSRILIRRNGRNLVTKSGRLQGNARLDIGRRGHAPLVENEVLATCAGWLAAHLRKECGE